jgi:hypothetical protein
MKRSGMMRCRPGTVPVCGGPGSALHRFAALALHRIRDTQASDAFVALFTFQTAQIFSFPRRVFAPGFLQLCFAHPNRGVGGAPRNVRVQRHPLGLHMTRQARRLRGALRPMTRDARLSALHRGGFGLPGPRFRLLGRPPSYNGGQVPCGSVQRAPRTQVVVPGGRGPCLPRRAVTSRLPQDATPRSAFRIVSGDAPHERGWEVM